MFATVANAVMWLWTTVGVAVELIFQVIPASLGFVQTIDAGLSRTLFSWTLHAIVYFWLIPSYIAFYTMVPQAAGGRLYSDTMGRLTFIDRKSTRLNSSHRCISYAVFCLKKKKKQQHNKYTI